jgi:hypothetical protein
MMSSDHVLKVPVIGKQTLFETLTPMPDCSIVD